MRRHLVQYLIATKKSDLIIGNANEAEMETKAAPLGSIEYGIK
jgi:hypothetical protein